MNTTYINGIPSNVSPVEAAVFRTRVSTALADLCRREEKDRLAGLIAPLPEPSQHSGLGA